jgi:hypothetical protein
MRPFADAESFRAWLALNCEACARRQLCEIESFLTMAVAFDQITPPEVARRCGAARFSALCRLWPCPEFLGQADGYTWDIEEFARQIDTWPRDGQHLTPTRKITVPQWLCTSCEALVADVLARVVGQMERSGRSSAEIAVVREVRALLVRTQTSGS